MHREIGFLILISKSIYFLIEYATFVFTVLFKCNIPCFCLCFHHSEQTSVHYTIGQVLGEVFVDKDTDCGPELEPFVPKL